MLIFVGDQDHHYKKDVMDKLKNRSNVRIELLENVNHSLDIAGMDTSRSIEVMKQVVESVGVFMKE
ncbi:hypothetical protein GLW00_12400 [Halobacillus litoralis]|uniref:Alpha/beta hydrolase n=1 Tax=Halobacillus litoralis TaxID=45668 RepID=A0A845FCJ4_9BACI|nr:hypothetical protein [Halobacillus litoralis]MYL71660.1 hypothetical protein [Halobacillus litoralis]